MLIVYTSCVLPVDKIKEAIGVFLLSPVIMK